MIYFDRDLQRRQILDINITMLLGKLFDKEEIPVKTFANLFLGSLQIHFITRDFVTRLLFHQDPTPDQKIAFGIKSRDHYCDIGDSLFSHEDGQTFEDILSNGPDRRLQMRVTQLDQVRGNIKELAAFIKRHKEDPDWLIY